MHVFSSSKLLFQILFNLYYSLLQADIFHPKSWLKIQSYRINHHGLLWDHERQPDFWLSQVYNTSDPAEIILQGMVGGCSSILHNSVVISHVRAMPQAPPQVEDVTCGHIGSRQISILMRYLKAWRAQPISFPSQTLLPAKGI